MSFTTKGKIKTFLDEQTLKEVVTIRPMLPEMVRKSTRGNKRTLDSNWKSYKEIKNTGKSNYIGKYKSQYYCIFGLYLLFLQHDLTNKCIKQDYKFTLMSTESIN